MWRPTALKVSIDVHPDSTKNPINPKSAGVVPVAILGSVDIPADTLVWNSARFGKNGTAVAPRNADLKAAVTKKAQGRHKGALKKATVSELRRLVKSPDLVRKFFQHDPVKYAA